MSKKALISGVTEQDGAYLAEFLLGKEYEVHGIWYKEEVLSVYSLIQTEEVIRNPLTLTQKKDVPIH